MSGLRSVNLLLNEYMMMMTNNSNNNIRLSFDWRQMLTQTATAINYVNVVHDYDNDNDVGYVARSV